MNDTKIEWTEKTWNPVSGCLHECEYCYAKAIYSRFKMDWTPKFHDKRLNEPVKIKNESNIFVCSVADLFGDWIPNSWIEKVLNIVDECRQHNFQFLTKNPKRLLEFDFPKNCIVGCSATDQKMYNKSVNVLSQLDNKTFLSCEPLLGEIKMNTFVDWVIVGACSYPKHSQPKKEWVTNIINYCRNHNIPIFLKPNLKVYNHELFKEFPVLKVRQSVLI